MRIAHEHADSFVTYPQAPNLSAKAKPIRERQARQLPPRILVPAQLGPIGGSVGGLPGLPPVGLTCAVKGPGYPLVRPILPSLWPMPPSLWAMAPPLRRLPP